MADVLQPLVPILGPLALIFFFIGAFPGLVGLRNGYSGPRRRRPKQEAALEQLLRTHSGGTLRVDWMHFADLPKQHIQDVLAPAGWRYSHEDVSNGEWWLVFTHSPHTPYTGPAERLTRELANVDGDTYKMNAVRYGALGIDEFQRIIQDAGWRTDYVRLVDGMAVERDLELTEMPRNPALAPLVNEYYNKHGYSPLDPQRILHLRSRKKYWARKSIGCLGLLVCLACLVLGPLILALSMSDLARDSAEVITFWVGSGLTAIAVALIGYEIWISNIRKGKDIGDHQKILKELTKLHKETRRDSGVADPSRQGR